MRLIKINKRLKVKGGGIKEIFVLEPYNEGEILTLFLHYGFLDGTSVMEVAFL